MCFVNLVMKDIVANEIYDYGQKYDYWPKKMCLYRLHSHIVINDRYDYKPSLGCKHICHVLV
jgi:hypothetical protein